MQHTVQEQVNNQTGAEPVHLLGSCELTTTKIPKNSHQTKALAQPYPAECQEMGWSFAEKSQGGVQGY